MYKELTGTLVYQGGVGGSPQAESTGDPGLCSHCELQRGAELSYGHVTSVLVFGALVAKKVVLWGKMFIQPSRVFQGEINLASFLY